MWSPRSEIRLALLIFVAAAAGVLLGQTTPGYVTQASTWLINSLIDATPIGNTIPSTAHFTDAFATGAFHGNATTATTLANNALQSAGGVGCTTGTTSYAQCTSLVSWPTPYADTAYHAACTIVNPTGSPTIAGLTRGLIGVTVTIRNGDANGAVASGGLLDCVGYHP